MDKYKNAYLARKKILKILSVKPMKISEIAKKTGCNLDATRARVRRLRKNGLVIRAGKENGFQKWEVAK